VVDIIELVVARTCWLVLLIGDLPDLEDVVLGTRSHHKPLIQVPRDVLDLTRVPSVDKD